MSSLVLLLGRLLASAIFIQAGYSKLGDVGGTIVYLESTGVPSAGLVVWPVIALELLGGLAVLMGLLTRPVALALAVFAIAAAAIGHSDYSSLMHFQAFMKDLAISGGYLFLAIHGPGALSLDAWLARGRART
jgi:putative oxidoreductase